MLMSLGEIPIQRENSDLVKASWGKNQNEESIHNVTITDINIPFISLVAFLVKLTIAAIPAAIIVTIFWTIIFGFLAVFIDKF